MKKPMIALIPFVMLISSCGNNVPSSSESTIISSEVSSNEGDAVSSIESSEPTKKKTASDLLKFLKKLAKGNYTLNTTYEGKNYNVFYNERYAYNESAKAGYALLPSYYEGLSSSDILYSFQTGKDNSISLGNVVVGGYSNEPITDLDDLNYLSIFSSAMFTAKSLEEIGENTFQTDSYWALVSFYGLFGYNANDASTYLDSVTLKYLSEEELSITLDVKEEYKDSFGDESELTSILKSIGSTSVDFIESYQSSFNVANLHPLSMDQANVLSKTSGRVSSTFYKVESTLQELDHSCTIDFNEEFYSLQEDGTSILYRKALKDDTEHNLYAGDAYTVSLNPKNEVVYGTMHYAFDELFDSGRSLLPEILAGSFKNEDGTYTYHGPNAGTYLSYLTGAQLEDISSMHFFLNNNQIYKIVTIYTKGDDTYQMETTFGDYVAPNTKVKQAVADSNTPTIKAAFDATKGDIPFQMTISDDGEEMENIYVFSDLVVNDDQYMGGISGFKKNEDGSVSTFSVTQSEDGYVSKATQAPSTSISLNDAYQSITAAPKVFSLSSDGKSITAKDAVGGFGGYLPGLNLAQMLDGTLKMSLKDGRISSISFNYSFFGSVGTETITFTYNIDKSVLDSKLLSSINNMAPYVAPASWKEANPDIYQCLVDILESHADEVSFFDIDGVDESKLNGTYADSYSSVEIFSDNTHTAFVDGYKEELKKDTSFSLSSSGYDDLKKDSYETYQSSTLQIKIYSQDYLGIYISLLA